MVITIRFLGERPATARREALAVMSKFWYDLIMPPRGSSNSMFHRDAHVNG